MNKLSYKNVVSKGKEKSNGKLTRLVLAFMGGAIIAFIGQALYDLYFFVFNINEKDSLSLMLVTIIFISALLTGFGLFDKLGQIFGAGTFVPIIIRIFFLFVKQNRNYNSYINMLGGSKMLVFDFLHF